MTEIITGLSPQPRFPREDLTDENASLLELMMANHELLERSHTAVEQLSYLFQVGHKSIRSRASHLFDDTDRIAALDHGITSFEAITAMVDGSSMVSDIIPVHNQALRIMHMDETELGSHIDQALDDFRQQTPRTAEVVRASSSRFHGPLTTYALLGAAMSRHFELSIV